jgi:hypothetical protein
MMRTPRWWFGPCPRPVLPLVCAALLLAFSPPARAAAAEWKERTTRYTVILHQPEHANTAEQLAGLVDPIAEQMAALHNYSLRQPLTIRLFATTDAYAQSSDLARTPYGQIAQASAQSQELAIAEPRLRNLTPEQLRNLFRRGLSQLMLSELTGGRMPIGLLQGAAQYSEAPTPEVEVNARALDKARRDRMLLSWADLNAPDRFAAQSEVAAAEGYAAVAFLIDRYGLAAWQRFIAAARTAPNGLAALEQAYGKPLATLESEWQAYLPEYFGGSYRINYFARYELGVARGHLQAGRYHEARDELEAIARFIAGAGRTAKEAELRDLAGQVTQGLEADLLLAQGQAQMASFQYAAARDTFLQAKTRFETIGAAAKAEETATALAAAESGLTAIDQLEQSKRLLSELKYPEARAAAMAAIKTFASLSDEERYRQTYQIIQELDATLIRIAYVLGGLALANVVWAAWRLTAQARRRAIPGVLQ